MAEVRPWVTILSFKTAALSMVPGCRPFTETLPCWTEKSPRWGGFPARRADLRREAVDATDSATFSRRWDLLFIAKPELERNQGLAGKSIADLAAETGKNVLDAFLDIVVEEKLETGFEINQTNGDEKAVAQILSSPYTVIGLSDAGAHVVFDAGYGFCTRFLGFWVRDKQIMSLEDAVRKLTFHSATVFGLHGRGLLRPRLIQQSSGIHDSIVNGTVLVDNNEHTGPYPGQMLRTPAYRAA